MDSPMLAKGSNPAMDASKIPLDKNIKKHKKDIDKHLKVCYNIIIKGNHLSNERKGKNYDKERNVRTYRYCYG